MFCYIKDHETESKAFSKSINSSIPGILFSFAVYKVSYIIRVFSPINLFFRKPFWFSCMRKLKTCFILLAIHAEIILYDTFRSEIGLQFLRNSRLHSWHKNYNLTITRNKLNAWPRCCIRHGS